MKITIEGYPLTHVFHTTKTLPPFQYGCGVRTKIAVKKLNKLTYSAPHGANDFIVETIEIWDGHEIWHLGS